MSNLDDLRSELDSFSTPKKKSKESVFEERVIFSFLEIQKFVDINKRKPEITENRDIFERMLGVRLNKIATNENCKKILLPLDRQNLFHKTTSEDKNIEDMNIDQLAAELDGIEKNNDISKLKHVRSTKEIKAAEQVANREICKDFSAFEIIFKKIKDELKEGHRQTRRYAKETSIELGNFFILNGLLVFVAEVGQEIKAPNGERDARLRVIFENGTESNLLKRSLQRALYKDDAGRRISDPNIGPLFDDQPKEGDIYSGVIYVCQSNSEIPKIKENRNNIHKIGVTKGTAKARISGAKDDPTFLFADVSLKATFELYGIEHLKLEKMIHDIFASAKLDIEIQDRFGKPYKPQEWFLVSLETIEDAVQKIKEGSIINYNFDIKSGILIKNNES